MRIKNGSVAVLFVLLLPVASCNSTNRPSARSEVESVDDGVSILEEQFETAVQLAARGRHLEASIYFEAALDGGSCELETLPLLISSQVRAGRLEAAKQNVTRLAEIAPRHEGVLELARTLNSLTFGDYVEPEGVTR